MGNIGGEKNKKIKKRREIEGYDFKWLRWDLKISMMFWIYLCNLLFFNVSGCLFIIFFILYVNYLKNR